jgi:hypothetical protein
MAMTRLFRSRVRCRAMSDDTVVTDSEFYSFRDVLATGKPVEVGLSIVLLIAYVNKSGAHSESIFSQCF